MLDHSTRSGNLASFYDWERHPQALLKFLILGHAWPFAIQYLLTVLQSICVIVPQTALFFLLRSLEASGSREGNYTGKCVLVPGSGMLIQTFLGTWAHWMSFSRLKIPIQLQLAALMFQKALRRRDVKSVSENQELAEGTSSEDESQTLSEDRDNRPGEGIINLIGVDAKRVSDFAAYNNLMIGSVCKLLASFGFLVMLIG